MPTEQHRVIEDAIFSNTLLVNWFKKITKAIEEQWIKQVEAYAVLVLEKSANTNNSNTNTIDWRFVFKRSVK